VPNSQRIEFICKPVSKSAQGPRGEDDAHGRLKGGADTHGTGVANRKATIKGVQRGKRGCLEEHELKSLLVNAGIAGGNGGGSSKKIVDEVWVGSPGWGNLRHQSSVSY